GRSAGSPGCRSRRSGLSRVAKAWGRSWLSLVEGGEEAVRVGRGGAEAQAMALGERPETRAGVIGQGGIGQGVGDRQRPELRMAGLEGGGRSRVLPAEHR